jgi:selenocysteine lyase/cysteine desulfurase
MRLPKLDIGFVRAHFPAFLEQGMRNWAYFDNAGASFTCRYVIWRLSRFYKERKLLPFGPSEPSRLGGEEMQDARISISQMMGVQAEEVSFGPSAPQNAYVLARAFEEMLPRGATIIVTDQDDEAMSGPFRRLARSGVRIREWRMQPDGRLYLGDLAELLDQSVRLVCFPHCSDILGDTNDVAAIARLAHSAGANTLVDGVGHTPHGLPQIGAIGADIYLFSANRTYGPEQGIMYVRRSLALELPHQGHEIDAPDLTNRFVPSGPDHAQMAACTGICDYVDALYAHHFTAGRDAKGRAAEVARLMRAQEAALMRPIHDWLSTREDIRVLGPGRNAARAPVLSLDIPGSPLEAQAELARRGLIVGAGSFRGERALTALGVPPKKGVLRISLLHYTLPDEVDHLLTALDQLL